MAYLEHEYAKAARLCARGQENRLVVVPYGTDIPGALFDDNVTAIAAIDMIRHLLVAVEDKEDV
jgi:hypothetical protein